MIPTELPISLFYSHGSRIPFSSSLSQMHLDCVELTMSTASQFMDCTNSKSRVLLIFSSSRPRRHAPVHQHQYVHASTTYDDQGSLSLYALSWNMTRSLYSSRRPQPLIQLNILISARIDVPVDALRMYGCTRCCNCASRELPQGPGLGCRVPVVDTGSPLMLNDCGDMRLAVVCVH